MVRRSRSAARGATRWLCAFGAATMAIAPAALAQQGGARPPRPAPAVPAPPAAPAATAQAELEAVRAALDESDRRLRVFVASLAEREATTRALDSLGRLQHEREMLLTRARLLQARLRFRETEVEVRRRAAPAGPQGWFGVNVTTTGDAGVTPDGRLLVASDYPVVRSVEPGSPAARAGVQAGDRLITILGRDLRSESVDLSRVLRPNTTVPVRIVRDGRPIDVALAITARPTSFGPARIRVDVATAPTAPRRADRPAVQRVEVRGATVRGGTPEGAEPGARTVPRPQSYLSTTSSSVIAVAGAEVMTLTAGVRSTHGVERGIYVVSILPGTPADEAGLHAGDVLVRAGGTALGQPLDLARVVQRETRGDRRVSIELLRGRQARTVEMRW